MNKFVNGKMLIGLFSVTNIIYFTMIIWSIPRLLDFSDGLPIFDMSPGGYSYDQAVELLTALGNEGIHYYLGVQHKLDTLYPLGLILTYSIGCLWFFRTINRWQILGKVGAVLSLFAGIFDYAENYFVSILLNNFPDITQNQVATASSATLAKSICTTISMSIFIIGLILFVHHKIKARRL